MNMTLKDVIKTENIIKVAPSDNLSKALGHLSSSHDAAFIFDEEGKYCGVINPYYSVIKTTYPGQTKVQNCVFHPPKLHLTDTLEKVAKFMSDSKIHYLPIFDEQEKFIGITTARRILKMMLNTDAAKKLLIDVVNEKNRPVITIDQDDLVQNALENYKEYKISKLVVVDRNMKVKGVISYYDLMPYLIAPGGKQQRATNVNEKEFLLNKKVKNYSQKTILACEMEDTIGNAISSILKHGMGSVIVKDDEGHPVGIVTTRDILNLLQPSIPRKTVEFTLKNVSDVNEKPIQEFYRAVDGHIQNTDEIIKGRIVVAEEKNGGLFRITVQMTPQKGEPTVYEKEDKDLTQLIKEIRHLVTKKQV